MFRELSKEDQKEFRNWARENYVTFSPTNAAWHPIVRDECGKMNSEAEDALGRYVITLEVRCLRKEARFIKQSILDGMEFDSEKGERIINYDINEAK